MLHKIDPRVREIIARLQEHGYETYVVGGAVRDILMDREPKDYDVSTAATPEDVRRVFGRRQSMIIGKRFRLVHVRISRDEIVEVSTFRCAPPSAKSAPSERKPYGGPPIQPNLILRDNEYGTAEEDAWRRDFTVNAIFYDPVADKLIDYTGMGIRDLKNGVIRVIGDPQVRFEEDPVRLLRALKLVGQYNWALESGTAESLALNLRLIEHASVSRLSLELEKILKGRYGHAVLEAFRRYGFLKYYLPWLDAHWDTDAGRYAVELLKMRNKRVENGIYRDSVSLALAALVLPFIEHSIGHGNPGELWENVSGVRHQIFDMMKSVVQPYSFCQWITNSAARMMMSQPYFHKNELNKDRFCTRSDYPHARELYLIQNAVTWLDAEAEERFPKVRPHLEGEHDPEGRPPSRDFPPKKRRRPRRRRRNGNGRRPESKPDLSAD